LLRCFLGAKLHRMVITDANVDYVGSIQIDGEILRLSGILPGERVQVADLDNGERFETYVIQGTPGSGMMCINGAAARLVSPGDRVIVLQYVWVENGEAPPVPKIVIAGESNLTPGLLV
jgi:aspartate 1-decarboxylase